MSSCALYGKLASEADFVRIGAGLPGEIVLQRWLKAGIEESGGGLSEPAVHFVKHVEGSEPWAGVWVPSRDAVGRAFPLAVFAPLSEEVSQLPFSCLPSALSRFASEGEHMLRELTQRSLKDAQEACARLSPIHASELLHAWGRCTARANQLSPARFASDVFGTASSEQWFYALHTLRRAAEAGPAGMPSLAFPITDVEDAFVWLELLSAQCPMARPDLFWTSGPWPRLLATFSGRAPLRQAIWSEGCDDPSVWPVTTKQSAAVQEARARLAKEGMAMLDDERPLASYLPGLRRHG